MHNYDSNSTNAMDLGEMLVDPMILVSFEKNQELDFGHIGIIILDRFNLMYVPCVTELVSMFWGDAALFNERAGPRVAAAARIDIPRPKGC